MENTTPESKHPVLTDYRERIAELDTLLAKLQADYANLDVRYANEVRARHTYADSIKEVFVQTIRDDYDKETVVYLAEQLDIELKETKTYTVQVEFQVEVEVEIGEELEAYELDAEISGDSIQDYSFEITGIDEN